MSVGSWVNSPFLLVKSPLLGGIPTSLKHMSSSVGMMTFPTEWKVIPNSMVPNHQPNIDPLYIHYIYIYPLYICSKLNIDPPDTVGFIPMTSPFSNDFPMVFLWIYGDLVIQLGFIPSPAGVCLLVFRGSSVASGNVQAADFRRALEADGALQGHQSWEKSQFLWALNRKT